MIPLKKYYENIICYDMINKFNYTNIMQVPRILKVVVHLTVNEAVTNPKAIYLGLFIIELISGQRGETTQVKKPIYSFNITKNLHIGCKVTLRKIKMYFFLEKLLFLILPKIKDFDGLKNNKRSKGTFSFGLNHIFYFPEVKHYLHKYLTLNQIGLEVHIITSAQTTLERDILLTSFGFPIKKSLR